MKFIQLLLCQLLFVFTICGQVDSDEKIIFQDAKEIVPSYSYGDSILINSLNYKYIKKSRFRNLRIVKRQNEIYLLDDSWNPTLGPFEAKSVHIEKFGIQLRLDDKIGLVDFEGNQLVPTETKGIYHFSHNLVKVVDSNRQEALLDLASGIYSPSFCSIKIFNRVDSLLLVSPDCENYGIVDMNFDVSELDFIYQNPKYLSNKKKELWQIQKQGKVGVVNHQEEIYFPFVYDEIHSIQDYYVMKKDGLWGVMKNDKDTLLNIKYNLLKSINFDNDYLVEFDGKYGVINLDKKNQIPLKYEYLEYIPERNVFKAKLNNKFGIIDFYEEVILPFVYNSIEDNKTDGYIVKRDEHYGVVKYNGQQVIHDEHFSISIIRSNRNSSKAGYCVFRESNKNAFYDLSGKKLTQFIFERSIIMGSFQPIRTEVKGKQFYVNAWGQCVDNCPSNDFLRKFNLMKAK